MSEPKTQQDVPGSIAAHDVEHVVARSEAGEELPTTARFPFVPAWYALYYMAMCRTARAHGYALALHGSMQRDCDVVAVPWTVEAASAEVLVAALVERHGLVVGEGGPSTKPHGRRAWSLMVGGHLYFDVSVMPTMGSTP